MKKSIIYMILGLLILFTGVFSTDYLGVITGSIIAAIGGVILGANATSLAIKKSIS